MIELEACLKRRAVERGLHYELGPPASEGEFNIFSGRIEQSVPRLVRIFYEYCDGLTVTEPRIMVDRVGRLELRDQHLVPFCTVDGIHELAFDVSKLNAAEQWDIVVVGSRILVTKTMSSFWSNKLFAWIDKRRPIWTTEHVQGG